ncbi:RNA-binding S4 domain-containing protein [Panacagrimonas sp.]|uniref:RNA-binding S4 domain-containing protein n=1 Tax=Panacagrimonas sp. TaxID=2480088 RepID=UPI003B525A6D
MGRAQNRSGADRHAEDDGAVRLDKWLWAARFFRTRNLARQAIESGHVRYQGERAKVGRAVRIGAGLQIRQGWDEREVVVLALSDERRGAPEAQRLYEETAQSIRAREEKRELRAQGPRFDDPKPDKRDRRQGAQFKRSAVDS